MHTHRRTRTRTCTHTHMHAHAHSCTCCTCTRAHEHGHGHGEAAPHVRRVRRRRTKIGAARPGHGSGGSHARYEWQRRGRIGSTSTGWRLERVPMRPMRDCGPFGDHTQQQRTTVCRDVRARDLTTDQRDLCSLSLSFSLSADDCTHVSRTRLRARGRTLQRS
jgi:hypothetical protein